MSCLYHPKNNFIEYLTIINISKLGRNSNKKYISTVSTNNKNNSNYSLYSSQLARNSLLNKTTTDLYPLFTSMKYSYIECTFQPQNYNPYIYPWIHIKCFQFPKNPERRNTSLKMNVIYISLTNVILIKKNV